MVKKIAVYVCETCGAAYTTQHEAYFCEVRHKLQIGQKLGPGHVPKNIPEFKEFQ